jgi:hypothetical protein
LGFVVFLEREYSGHNNVIESRKKEKIIDKSNDDIYTITTATKTMAATTATAVVSATKEEEYG